ncbi:META domain-containing protein [Marinobacter panjinensis]|uniref:META domain-containing protein n=1 Tax=Marinobacter panjinensis TaxID=2576384 RepID=A0A4U6R877_9GAMM|nr:META domain-containing protein [Marinobacter panjinensis]MCR8914660.1 META domain-containing protein [Marinobacter panjinensis]TKV68526.1 META domain-containing protein [Marinobacter panjinensis]
MNGFTRCIAPALAALALVAGCSSTPENSHPSPASGPASGAVELPFTATGNEPFWRAIVEPGQLVLERMGESPVELRYDTTHSSATSRTFRAEGEGIRITLVAAHQLCRDSMTGMPYPNQVRLDINGEAFRGCGGEPARLLQGAEWVIEDIAGAGIIDSSRVTINFMAENRVSGSASCNNFTGGWKLTGEGLGFNRMASTRKACSPALMNQESRFLSLLSDITRFDIGRHGELLLISSDGRVITALPSTE